MTPAQIAMVCHEANRAYCQTQDDLTQKSWDKAEQWQRDSAVQGVQFAIENPSAPASAQHDAWLADKFENGWRYGAIKDAAKKEHPCCVPYDRLPEFQKRKDALFKAIVNALS